MPRASSDVDACSSSEESTRLQGSAGDGAKAGRWHKLNYCERQERSGMLLLGSPLAKVPLFAASDGETTKDSERPLAAAASVSSSERTAHTFSSNVSGFGPFLLFDRSKISSRCINLLPPLYKAFKALAPKLTVFAWASASALTIRDHSCCR